MVYRSSIEVFPEELRQPSIPEWRILLVFAYDGPSVMYRIKTEYGFKYPTVHRATQNLEKLKWIKFIEKQPSRKGGTAKVYGLTLIGLLHLLYRIPRSFSLLHRGSIPPEVETDLEKLTTQEDIALHLLYCFRFNKVAENNQRLLPLIFRKWQHLKDNQATSNVFASMMEVAHVTLGDYYGPTAPKGMPLDRLFAYKVYYNLLKKSMSTYHQPKLEGYAPFDYEKKIQDKAIAVFKGDQQLTALFKQIIIQIEEEATLLSESIERIKEAVLHNQ